MCKRQARIISDTIRCLEKCVCVRMHAHSEEKIKGEWEASDLGCKFR